MTDKPIKVILLGDSAVGKSKMMERFLREEYNPDNSSTFGVTIHRHATEVGDKDVMIEFWDTAGQPTFKELHPSFYDRAWGCVLVFDITRKETYTHLNEWYTELLQYRKGIPCCLVANKIDVDPTVEGRSFNFATKHKLPLYYVSAASGKNISQPFDDIVKRAYECLLNPPDDIIDDVLDLIQ
uniref:RABL2 n=1 Tax=Mastigamoeba balamuthi TaxID=108607 RepID=A0A125SEA0_MASBA|nr:RABL2 [Mastigamoeba balamuthi]|eukprot:m51a1_g9561 putative rab-like protein 2a-like (183) ;mRNA; f:903942-905058